MKESAKPLNKENHSQEEYSSLKKKNEIIGNLLNKVNDIVYRYEVYPEKRFTYVSKACYNLTGYTQEEHYSDKKLIEKIIHPDDAHLLDSAISNKNKQSEKLNLRWQTKAGALVWTEHFIDYEFDEGQILIALNGIARDITSQKTSEEKIIEHEARYKNIFNDVHEGILVFDKKTKVLEVNPEFERITGISRGDVIGNNGFELARRFGEMSTLSTLFKVIQDIITGKSVMNIQIPYFGKTLDITSKTRKKDSYHIAIIRDVTSEKESERKLVEAQKKYKNVIETTTEGFWLIDKNYITVEVNEALCQMLGYKKEEIIGISPLKFVNKDDQEILKKSLAKMPESKHRSFEITGIHKKGHSIYVLITATTVKDPNGNIKGSFAMIRDISEIKKKEKELLKTQSNLKSVLESTKDNIWSVDKDFRILTVNNHFKAEFKKYFGVELAKGVKIVDFVPESEKKKWEKRYEKAFKGEFNVDYETYELEQGTNFFEIRINPIFESDSVTGVSVISSNITERKKAENALKISEKKYRLIAENMSDGVFTTDENGSITYASASYIKQLGYSEDIILAKGKDDIYVSLHPDDRDETFREIYEAIEKRAAGLVYTFRTQNADGSYIWREDNASFNYDEDGKYKGSVVISRNITERKEMELSLKDSEEKLEQAQEMGKTGSYETDFVNGSLSGSRVFCEMFGFKFGKEYKQSDFVEVIHPADREEVISNFQECIEKHRDFNYQYRAINRITKEIIHVQSTGTIFYDHNNNPVRVFGTKQDITELKEAETQLRESERDLKLAQEIARVGNWSLTPGDEKPYWSEEVYKIYERNPANGPFKVEDYKKLYSKKYYKIFERSIRPALKEGKPYDIELFLQLPSGNKKWIHAICKPEAHKGPKGHKLHGTIQDITEQKLLQEKLIEAKEKAEQADQLKSAFLANMSHEIRTPMNGILGFADMLKDQGLSGEDQSEYIEIIEKSGKRMLDTVNDLIEISKIETKQVSLNCTDVDFNETVRSHFVFFEPEAKDKGLGFKLHPLVADKIPNLKSDPVKLDSIITNLIKNAIKYTPGGKIDIGYSCNDNTLEFYVKDTGLGIAKNRQEAIFNRFEQADISDKRAFEGSGLGLAITKSYVEMLNGSIWVESEEGKGSTFYVRLPISSLKSEHKNDPKNKEEKEYYQFTNAKLITLIVDDEETSALYLNKLLKSNVPQIYHANNGKKAIEMLKEHPEINLILMDVKMPLLDGYETTRLIRKFNTEIKIIAQTAFALEGDKKKALDAGCNSYLSKPINKEELFKIITSQFE